ncbi:hypothetical protein [Lichenicoccus sp.]|uniref:hypothetical protein n=1 Tax=Lichenicoccus sp. TaxID=2781899 RepID=UPI003D14DA6C
MLNRLFAGGAIIDAILVFVVLEGLLLTLLHRRLGWSGGIGKWAATLSAGFLLMLALRLALGGAAPVWLALCLLLSLCAHLVDLWLRIGPEPRKTRQRLCP